VSWRTWLRQTAIRLGIAEQGSIAVEDGLDYLAMLEERANALRVGLLETATTRHLYVEEATAYDVARGNLLATTKAMHSELLAMGVPGQQLPRVVMLGPLPAAVLQGVTLAPSGAISPAAGGALGAIRVGPRGVPAHVFDAGPDTVGVLKGLTIGVAVQYGLVVIGILAAGAVLTYYLTRLFSPEIALQQAVTDHDLGVAENLRDVLTEYERTRQAALESGVDPNTLPPPDVSGFATLATGNPLAAGLSSVKGLAIVAFAIGALFVGYKIYKDRREG
jgi:hypothetical protein